MIAIFRIEFVARQNLRGGISRERTEMYILSYKLALFCGAGEEVRQNLLGGFTRKPRNVHFELKTWAFWVFFVDLE